MYHQFQQYELDAFQRYSQQRETRMNAENLHSVYFQYYRGTAPVKNMYLEELRIKEAELHGKYLDARRRTKEYYRRSVLARMFNQLWRAWPLPLELVELIFVRVCFDERLLSWSVIGLLAPDQGLRAARTAAGL